MCAFVGILLHACMRACIWGCVTSHPLVSRMCVGVKVPVCPSTFCMCTWLCVLSSLKRHPFQFSLTPKPLGGCCCLSMCHVSHSVWIVPLQMQADPAEAKDVKNPRELALLSSLFFILYRRASANSWRLNVFCNLSRLHRN